MQVIVLKVWNVRKVHSKVHSKFMLIRSIHAVWMQYPRDPDPAKRIIRLHELGNFLQCRKWHKFCAACARCAICDFRRSTANGNTGQLCIYFGNAATQTWAVKPMYVSSFHYWNLAEMKSKWYINDPNLRLEPRKRFKQPSRGCNQKGYRAPGLLCRATPWLPSHWEPWRTLSHIVQRRRRC